MDENGNVNISYFDFVDFDQFVDNNVFVNQIGFGDNEFNGFNVGGYLDEFNFLLDVFGSGVEFGGGGVVGVDNGMLGGGGGVGLGINGQDGLLDMGRVFEIILVINSFSLVGMEEIMRSEIGGVGNGVVMDSLERDLKRRRRGQNYFYILLEDYEEEGMGGGFGGDVFGGFYF